MLWNYEETPNALEEPFISILGTLTQRLIQKKTTKVQLDKIEHRQ